MTLEFMEPSIAATFEATSGSKVPSQKLASSTLKPRHFAAFITACRCETFVQAARELTISQPSLSRNIHELEQALGKVLFLRADHRMELSSAGRQLLPLAIDLLSAHLLAMEQIAQLRSSRAKIFRAIASPWMVPLMTAPLLKLLQAEFDFSSVAGQSATCGDVEVRVASGEVPLGVSAGFTAQPELRCTPVLEAPLGVLVATGCAMPSHIDTLDALVNIPLVRLDDQASTSKLLQQLSQPFNAYLQAAVCLPCVTSGFDLIQQSGMGMITSGLEASHPQAIGMRFIPLPQLLPNVTVRVVSRRGNMIDPTQERMREILCDSLCDVDWHPSVTRLKASGSRTRERTLGI
jgi:DNA-binding transcriptional LysR family regulator